MERESLLAFSLVQTDTAQDIAAGIFQLNYVGSYLPLVLIAVRFCKHDKGAYTYKPYCQVVPQILVDAVPRGLSFQRLHEKLKPATVSRLLRLELCDSLCFLLQ